jgi:hypothetical protein
MSEIIWAAVIGVGGSVTVAIVTVITQFFITKRVINSEKEKIVISEETHSREKRKERIIDALSELLITSDPQSSKGVDYGRTTNLIIIVQLLLDISNADELALNDSLNFLGMRLHDYYPLRLEHIDNKSSETKALLKAHDNVIQKARTFFKNYNHTNQ